MPEPLRNVTTGQTLAADAVIARTLWAQAVGFIARRRQAWPEGALGIPHCSRVHTFGVARPLDIVLCDRGGQVLRVVAALPPNRVSPTTDGVYWTWEAEAGILAPHVRPGDILTWAEKN